ncbi:hypothetical protein GCM10027341_00860 [Spirosoma knui]
MLTSSSNSRLRKSILTLTIAFGTLLLFANAEECSPLPIRSRMVTSASALESGKIPIVPSRWYQVNNVSNGLEGLFDGITDVPVRTGWSKLVENYDAYYPLLEGEKMTIERIRFYDSEGTNEDAPMTLSIITDKWERIPIASFVGTTYNNWVGPDPDNLTEFALKAPVSNARYLVINTSGAYPSEMELYGTYQPGKAPTPTPVRSTPFRQSIGANAFEWNVEDGLSPWQVDEARIKALQGFFAIRHYMDWEKLEEQEGHYTYNPTLNGSWHYDVMYERLKAEGIEVLACLKTIPKWLQETYPPDERDGENVPAPYGSDLSSPASYIAQAKVGFQYIARYGSNKNVDPSLVKVSPITTWAGTNTVKIGMDLIHYIECENERDKTWKGRKAYQTAREYAANLSAFYDGHKNTLGPGVGVKNADPSVQVAIGGLAASTTDYLRAMIDWCREFRGYKPNGQINLCWDIINQHLYATDTKLSQDGDSERGAAPEVAEVGKRAAAFVDIAHQYANDMPVWITEAGYDINQGSPIRAIPIGRKSALETQADWTLRTALLYTRVGIDRLYFYQLYDDNIQNPVQFSSMGLINDNKTRKPAADYLIQARKLIGDYRYKETINSDPVVDRYELDGRSAYVLLIPDEQGRAGTYNLSVPKGDTVKLYSPTIGSDVMTRTTKVSLTGTIPLTVTETPLFALLSSTNGSEASNLLNSLRVYPTPAAEYVELTLENGSMDTVDVTVFSNSGQRIKQVKLAKTNRVFSERVDISTLPYGLYVLEVRQGESRVAKKIIRAH